MTALESAFYSTISNQVVAIGPYGTIIGTAERVLENGEEQAEIKVDDEIIRFDDVESIIVNQNGIIITVN